MVMWGIIHKVLSEAIDFEFIKHGRCWLVQNFFWHSLNRKIVACYLWLLLPLSINGPFGHLLCFDWASVLNLDLAWINAKYFGFVYCKFELFVTLISDLFESLDLLLVIVWRHDVVLGRIVVGWAISTMSASLFHLHSCFHLFVFVLILHHSTDLRLTILRLGCFKSLLLVSNDADICRLFVALWKPTLRNVTGIMGGFFAVRKGANGFVFM